MAPIPRTTATPDDAQAEEIRWEEIQARWGVRWDILAEEIQVRGDVTAEEAARVDAARTALNVYRRVGCYAKLKKDALGSARSTFVLSAERPSPVW